ncbi:molybdenum cofactor guanylyltransferase [Pontibacillus litoralis]|uniref:Probable molybdenum cofactor guanylyltransferase n=1 Tax=Pontibacillus litoralis JSM 072002 TaxID=1385512 RepID=A0A0A5HWN9_9BACI|nr:molybdenum cofactor guanylyltransferase [Pontibacillus litoralis]KGX88017.1 hypothetical protein N784_12415 [Pontibacillus litoralis JSM 072002]
MQALLLAGGASRRMGENKALLSIDGIPMIQRVVKELELVTKNICIATNEPECYSWLDYPIITDRFLGFGPLAALESGFFHSEEEWMIVSACDTPFIKREVYDELQKRSSSFQAVVPTFQGRIHPLSGMYHCSCYSTILALLKREKLRMKDLLQKVSTLYVPVDHIHAIPFVEEHFINLNTPEQFEKWKKTSN